MKLRDINESLQHDHDWEYVLRRELKDGYTYTWEFTIGDDRWGHNYYVTHATKDEIGELEDLVWNKSAANMFNATLKACVHKSKWEEAETEFKERGGSRWVRNLRYASEDNRFYSVVGVPSTGTVDYGEALPDEDEFEDEDADDDGLVPVEKAFEMLNDIVPVGRPAP
jgi:hypothetical protein